jgi:hypothetical protein
MLAAADDMRCMQVASCSSRAAARGSFEDIGKSSKVHLKARSFGFEANSVHAGLVDSENVLRW